MSDDSVRFNATVAQVKTMADGGIRITFDLQEDAIAEAALLMALRREGKVLIVTVHAVDADE